MVGEYEDRVEAEQGRQERYRKGVGVDTHAHAEDCGVAHSMVKN